MNPETQEILRLLLAIQEGERRAADAQRFLHVIGPDGVEVFRVPVIGS